LVHEPYDGEKAWSSIIHALPVLSGYPNPIPIIVSHLKSNNLSVLRIRDVYPGSRILIFTHPGSRISDPESETATKERGVKN
jgi:hypothetical protein